MKRIFSILALVAILVAGYLYINSQQYGAPPYVIDDTPVQSEIIDPDDFSNWKRPEGPLRVGLQAGHWKTSEMPDEQRRLKELGGGTRGSGVAEWELNLMIAEETAKLLEKEGIVVDILPATIPPAYWADAFVAIHADGSVNPLTAGFKVAAPRRDRTGKANTLVSILEEEYAQATNFPKDPNITRNMTGYYAFAWWRFEHAVHPMTPSVILETGFLTNPSEAAFLINNPEIPAQALATSLLTFLKSS